jgi:hypothetical protein
MPVEPRHNTSLKYFFMDNCAASHESQRHITAGIVSNSDVKLLAVTGFRIGGTSSLQEEVLLLIIRFAPHVFLSLYCYYNLLFLCHSCGSYIRSPISVGTVEK